MELSSSGVNVLDYCEFAYMYANKYLQKAYLLGYSKEDIEQTAILGLCVAKENYDPKKGAFTTHSRRYILNELNKLVYNNVRKNGEEKRELKTSDKLLSDYSLIDGDGVYYNSILDALSISFKDEEDNIWVKEFIDSLTLNPKEKFLFDLLLKYKQSEAIKNYKNIEGVTREAVHQRIRKLRKKIMFRYHMDIDDSFSSRGSK